MNGQRDSSTRQVSVMGCGGGGSDSRSREPRTSNAAKENEEKKERFDEKISRQSDGLVS